MAAKQEASEEPKKEPKEESKEGDGKKKDMGEAVDSCVTSSVVCVGLGLIGGFLGSVAVRQRWPIVVGLGFGAGQSIGCCREDFVDKDEEKKKKEEKENEKEGGKKDEKEGGDAAKDEEKK